MIKPNQETFYNLFLDKTHNGGHTGPIYLSSSRDEHWAKMLKTTRNFCKETKLKEFQFKLIHRIVVPKREIFKYGNKTDDKCCRFWGQMTRLTTLFFTAPLRNLIQKVIQSGLTYNSQISFSPTMEEHLCGITSNLHEKSTTNKINYITLFMRYFMHICKVNNKCIDLLDFVNAVQQRGLIENRVDN